MALVDILIGPIASIIDKIIPDKEAQARAKLELIALEGTQEMKMIEAQLQAIVAEARHRGVWERMKACRQETCGWLFYDGSRNRSSSWCSMSICGGREKARAYRRRTVAG